MIPFQERKKIRKILYSKVSLIVLAVILVVVVDGAWHIHQKAAIARAERDLAARDLLDLQTRSTGLNTSLVRLQSARGIEEDVRQKFTVARPGEDVVVVVDDSMKKSENSEAPRQKTWWEQILTVFGF